MLTDHLITEGDELRHQIAEAESILHKIEAEIEALWQEKRRVYGALEPLIIRERQVREEIARIEGRSVQRAGI